MNKGNTALRQHLTESESVVNTPDVELGLKYWREINALPNRWATFNATQYPTTRQVRIEWGLLYDEQYKERAIETIIFTMIGDEVFVTKHSHS